ncbi:MAG TPA: sulfur carrier protein ThiS [Desulfuromonadaceae bacterium]|jgi:sulfur carrier protein
MQVLLNGDTVDIRDKSTIAELLEQLQIGRERVAVEVNLEIVPKADYGKHALTAGDKIEIVHFVGGG